MNVFLRDKVPESSVITLLEHGSFSVVSEVSVRTSGLDCFFFSGENQSLGSA